MEQKQIEEIMLELLKHNHNIDKCASKKTPWKKTLNLSLYLF